ncbi:MAG: hypothetical protein HYY95_05845 [Candidatus Rokubacteria bacterium]|nr:hypothetical protein [Candidatus Rokubacteria bacterium]
MTRDVCPFEGCAYGTWVARSRLTAYAAEGDTSKIAFAVKPGERVTAVRGNVHVVKLGVVAVTAPIEAAAGQTLRPGDRAYVLSYRGEGRYDVWHAGRLMTLEPFWEPVAANGRVAGILRARPEMMWWVLIKTKSGRQGWLRLRNMAEHGFEMKEDICMRGC